MPYIRVIPIEEATGLLKRLYENAIRRAGHIWNIVSIMSVQPRTMQASIDGLYTALMFGESGLSRAQREMIAVVVSAANRCPY
ncbi:MAG TPA: carboxymuconolactone decarboxylase family protein [Roseiflexaceae bacterium]|jgi:alkylhydroperoxidase family enzyme